MRPAAAWEPWGAAKAKAHFWKWFTIDLIFVSSVTDVFDLSAFWVSLFVVVPFALRERIIARNYGDSNYGDSSLNPIANYNYRANCQLQLS